MREAAVEARYMNAMLAWQALVNKDRGQEGSPISKVPFEAHQLPACFQRGCF